MKLNVSGVQAQKPQPTKERCGTRAMLIHIHGQPGLIIATYTLFSEQGSLRGCKCYH